jgi:hypothetical protein
MGCGLRSLLALLAVAAVGSWSVTDGVRFGRSASAPTTFQRHPALVAVHAGSWEGSPEYQQLQDLLMERSVEKQLHSFQTINDRTMQMWLQNSWTAFSVAKASGRDIAGHMSDFLNELMRREGESIFVPVKKRRQGSAENPFLQPRPDEPEEGYHVEVDPYKVASKLMAWREYLAERWILELRSLATGAKGSSKPMRDEQLLVGLATRIALREMLHELSLRPSQAAVHQQLANFMLEHTDAMGPGGNVEGMLEELEEMPITIFGEACFDPMLIAAEIRGRRSEVEEHMARMLEDAAFKHLELRADFLEACLRL